MKSHLLFLVVIFFVIPVPFVYGEWRVPFDKPLTENRAPAGFAWQTGLFKMCDVLPGTEVESLSPFDKPFNKATPHDPLEKYAGCHYDFVWKDDYPQIDISVNEFESAAAARESLNILVESFKGSWGKDPEYITGLGDSAAFFGTDSDYCDICNLDTISGRYYIDIKFKGYAQSILASRKKDSGVKLTELLFQKKPFLKNKK